MQAAVVSLALIGAAMPIAVTAFQKSERRVDCLLFYTLSILLLILAIKVILSHCRAPLGFDKLYTSTPLLISKSTTGNLQKEELCGKVATDAK